MKIERCCYVNNKMIQCKNDAEFGIYESNRRDPDNGTFACTKHVGELLGTTVGYPECHFWHIYEI